MKKYTFFLFIFCLQLMPAKAQWVPIPDANFVYKLTQLYPSCMNGNLMDTTCTQILNAVILNVTNSNISDLTGVEYFVNLENLGCSGNNLTILPELPNSIVILTCDNNHITNLPQLPNNLLSLNCKQNQLNELPNIPSTLNTLVCEYNQLTSLPTLPNSLLFLLCSNNQLTYVPAVPNVMTQFVINDNNILCLANLPNVPNNFPYGNISNNPLTCVPNQTTYSFGLPLCLDNDTLNNSNNCQGANITGFVYTDIYGICNYDGSDLNSENIPVKLFDSQNNLMAQSYTINGAYSFANFQPDTFQIKINDNLLPISIGCGQTNNQIIHLDSINQTLTNINFPIVCDTAFDIKVSSVNSVGLVFPGQQHTVNSNIINNINWYNLNCGSTNYSGTVSINLTGPVTYLATSYNSLIPAVNGNTFTYNITDFSTLTPNSFGLQFLTDTTAQANDQICVHVEINPTPMDADTTNNSYDFCYQVVNSYDPNMKEVYPVNVLPGYDDWFTYTIHFQNTGNAPAFNIRLRDTLDTNLDINSFEMLGYSHPAIVSINGNILTVRFNNIMLPDSATDYEGSMGYFQYRLKPLSNLPLGTQIENTAYIYFDYNDPIVTNTTQNNFQMVVSTFNNNESRNQLSVFPNPANEMLNIMLQNSVIENCIISNALGQSVYNSANEINANHKIQLNIANLSPGVYFVKVRTNNASYMAKFIKSE